MAAHQLPIELHLPPSYNISCCTKISTGYYQPA